MNTPILSICIPTYNRAELLRQCLDSVLPQIGQHPVEVIVIDNASPDHTASLVKCFMEAFPCLRYHCNLVNLGYAGNQVKCFEYTTGRYTAILCDDDLHCDGSVETILKAISGREYAFLAMNYYAFLKNPQKVFKSGFAPEDDVMFERARDILNHPSFGHFSGFVFNTRLAIAAMKTMLEQRSIESFEKMRGILVELPARSMVNTDLPAYFIGRRIIAARVPAAVDYDSLHHLCLDYYEVYQNLHKEHVISKSDLDYRANIVLALLPKALIRCGGYLRYGELEEISHRLKQWFGDAPRFRRLVVPILWALKWRIARICLKCVIPPYLALHRAYMVTRS